MVDVAGPFTGIRIGTTAQLREEVEFQVVVRVDQAGKHHMAGKIEVSGSHIGCAINVGQVDNLRRVGNPPSDI
jgi:hypothetical protein